MNDFEKILLEYCKRVNRFNDFIVKEYSLIDIPYNLSGKAFPKIGGLEIDSQKVSYRFHGKGCTIFWENLEISFDVDASSIHKIIVSSWAYRNFLIHFLNVLNEEQYPFSVIDNEMKGLEEKGVFMKRKVGELSFHVNENWYQSKKGNSDFKGESID